MSTKSTITEALLDIVATDGLDGVSVRTVAARADVSIGTVQHYFPSKDTMLSAAYAQVVGHLRERIEAVTPGDDLRDSVTAVLRELLPLDERRTIETRIHLAFAARAATSASLASIQCAALTEIHDALTERLATLFPGPRDQAANAAHAAIAVADGLALHAVSAGGWLPAERQVEALSMSVAALLGTQAAAGNSAHPRSTDPPCG